MTSDLPDAEPGAGLLSQLDSAEPSEEVVSEEPDTDNDVLLSEFDNIELTADERISALKAALGL